jgi:membrane-associated phospholipid phosphatase
MTRIIVLEIASWINVEEAGTFFGQHAILIFGLVLVSLLSASVCLNCLLYRLSPEGHLRLFSAIPLFVLTVTGVSFLFLAFEIGQQDWLIRFDHSLCASLHEHTTVNAVWIFKLVSVFGDASTLASMGLLFLVVLVVTRYWRLFFLWAISLPGAGILNQFLKDTFQRQRPHLPNRWIAESGWSFPSGHAMCSLVIYGLLSYSICVLSGSRTLRLSFGLLTVSLVIAIGFSRLYLGAHYFSDVMAGYLAATFWLVLSIKGSQAVRCVSAVGSSLRAREARETGTDGATTTSRTIVR